ncbi:MAG: hypothetical protein IPK10_20410 [Bacteroidetes bacterium]|nr:hypothetical protein [Bacteroidota bacterium]
MEPIVSGYGFGLRNDVAKLFGADWAWELTTEKLRENLYFSLGLDF